MKSRAGGALAFGLFVAIILGTLTLYIPKVTDFNCKGVKSTQFSILNQTIGSGCAGGEVTQAVGWPFRTKSKELANTERNAESGTILTSSEYTLNPSAVFIHYVLFWIVAFLFFLIFSPTKYERTENIKRNKKKDKKNRKNISKLKQHEYK